ncbi:hypothetical protein GCM10009131_12440 [Morganella psychrotolerans]
MADADAGDEGKGQKKSPGGNRGSDGLNNLNSKYTVSINSNLAKGKLTAPLFDAANYGVIIHEFNY